MVLFSKDALLLLGTRVVRLFAYGLMSVVLVVYLTSIGLTLPQTGVIITATLAGDVVVSLFLTTQADMIGRRKILIIGSVLMICAGIVFCTTTSFILLLIAAFVGVVSPTGNEVGPFLSVEQAALTQIIPSARRTRIFARYYFFGTVAVALGSLSGGALVQYLQDSGISLVESYRAIMLGYIALGAILGVLGFSLSPSVEIGQGKRRKISIGLQRSRKIVFSLSALFALDAFGGGFVIQSIVAYWFYVRFHADLAVLGGVFFGANILGGLSSIAAAFLAKRIGLIRTMVFTHIPSNVLLILIPFMPTLGLSITVLLLRYCISQMDVPTRQSYVMAVVDPQERSSAAGFSTVARSVGASLAPICTGPLLASAVLVNVPFVIAGTLKLVYDCTLYGLFRSLKPPEEVK